MHLVVQRGQRQPTLTHIDRSWILLARTWNDYSYLTLYDLFREHNGQLSQFGSVKILKRGQGTHETPLPEGQLLDGRLPDEYGSLGSDLDYYVQIATLPRAEARELLASLGDIALNSDRRTVLANEAGLRRSLHRNLNDPAAFYSDAIGIIDAGGHVPEEGTFSFEFVPSGADLPINFCFKPARDNVNIHDSSHRLVVLIGRNGVGKTSLLAKLARVAYAPPNERPMVADHGRFIGSPAFPSIVAVSYSAFDNFDLPRLEGDNPREVAKQIQEGTGRYAYCGMRDIPWQIENPAEPERLMSLGALENVFADRIEQIKLLGRTELFAAAIAPVFAEESFDFVLDDDDDPWLQTASDEERNVALLNIFLGDDPRAALHSLSSGHKIVLHLLASLTACLKRRGLALIDEPETHLHPPLLAAMMMGIRRVLVGLRAYAVVASHSPVVAQETLARHVLKIESGSNVREPGLETFGENTGTLTRELFGLHTDATDFRRVLNEITKRHHTVEEIEAYLGSSLSPPALAHVMATLKRQGK